VVLAIVMTGCAARRVPEVAPEGAAPATSPGVRPPGESLETFMKKVQAISSEARMSRVALKTIEASDPRLAAALAASIVDPRPQTFRAVSAEYQRLRIGDRAFEFLSKALAMDRSDWQTYDALARMWRDQGFPNLALSDAYRAVYYAPSSAAARNTLGTVFQAMGRRADAARQYEMVLTLDPNAAYAFSNLCYTRMLAGNARTAIEACEEALVLEPDLTTAQNNLGLAYAAAGDLRAAGRAFDATGDRAAALFNAGMVNLARGRYADAVSAFAAAQVARPTMRIAAARQRQAELAVAGLVK